MPIELGMFCLGVAHQVDQPIQNIHGIFHFSRDGATFPGWTWGSASRNNQANCRNARVRMASMVGMAEPAAPLRTMAQ